MEPRYAAPDLAILDTADRLGRAAHLWLCQPSVRAAAAGSSDASPVRPSGSRGRRQFIVAGFIAELCEALDLSAHHGMLAAHTYALLDGEEVNSLEIASILLDFGATRPTAVAFGEGRLMARDMLCLLSKTGHGEPRAAGLDRIGTRFPG